MGRRAALIGITILLCTLIFGAVVVQATAPVRETLTFEYIWTGYGTPKKEWTANNGISHTLQTPHTGVVTAGDIGGSVYYCGNLKIDWSTFCGKGGGMFEFTGFYNGEAAGFKGKLIFEIVDAELTGTLNCLGSGAFENVLLKGTMYTILGGTAEVTLVLWT
ncbi:MAG: hypothetical protein ACXAC6_13475 [Candidatus Hodarchaeales archaeon]